MYDAQPISSLGVLSWCRVTVISLIIGLSSSFSAQAIPLDLDGGVPDIASAFIDVSYDAELQLLTAQGVATDYLPAGQPGPPMEAIENGAFQLTASVDNSGELIDGALVIDGSVESLGFISGSLLTGQLTELGFNALGGDPLEFLFIVSGGDAAEAFGLVGGIILNVGGTQFPGNFSVDFSSNTAGGTSDTLGVDSTAISVPSSLWLIALGALGLRLRRQTSTHTRRVP